MIYIDKTTSIKSVLIWIIMLVCTLTLFITMTLSALTDIRLHQSKLISQLENYITIIAFNAENTLLSNANENEDMRLNSLAAAPILHNVHVYKLTIETNQLSFFNSYNHREIGPHPVQFNFAKNYTEPLISDDHVEMAKAITHGDTILGYVYIRASLDELKSYAKSRVLLAVLMTISGLFVAFFISLKLQKRLTTPLYNLLNLIQKVTKNKNYHLRAPESSIAEYNKLNRSFNVMLDRTERQINKLQETELEKDQLRLSLEQKIEDRTQALKNANQELLNTLSTLHKYQNQIIETEKMASLGQMVAGVAHEVNTPIGLGITSSTLLQDKLSVIETAFEDKKLTASQLAKFLSDSKENLAIIYRNLERAAALISSFKQVAVDQSNDNRRIFNVHQLINEVVFALQPNLRKTTHTISVNCSDKLEIDSKPGPINQILINLVMNSLIHAFENIENGQIQISISVKDNECCLTYQDNGVGVSESLKKRIFDPFVTTKRGEGGSGLGLHLVYNLVTQALNGKIKTTTALGEGLRFDIYFPVIVTQNN